MRLSLFVVALLLGPSVAFAHQPVMDMAPRWKNGTGFQILTYYSLADRLETDGRSAANPNGLKKEEFRLSYEGVYTFTRAFRVTLKVPQIRKSEIRLENGVPRRREAEGLGDIKLATPMKLYFNGKGYTGNFSFSPTLILPTGSTESELPLGRGTVDYGLSLGASRSSFRTYALFDIVSRINTEGADGTRRGNMVGFDWDMGIHPYHNNKANAGFWVMMGFNGRWQEKTRRADDTLDPDTGGRSLEVVPTLVANWHNWMWRPQYHVPVLENLYGTQAAQTYKIQTGLGVTFRGLKLFGGKK